MTAATDDANLDGLVWHYTDGPGLVSILGHHVLWATSSQFLNDSQEVSLGFRMLADRVEHRAAAGDPLCRLIAEKLRHVEPRQGPSDGHFFILSASRTWDSLAMWRSYGRARECYAIGLDPAAPLLVLGDETGHPEVDGDDDGFLLRHRPWAPVHYSGIEQEALVDAVLDRLPDQVTRLRERRRDPASGGRPTIEDAAPQVADLLDDLEAALLLSKHEGFREEQETRYATVLYRGETTAGRAADVSSFVRFRSTSYGITPYLRLTGSPEGADTTGAAGGSPAGTTRPAPLPIRAVAISPSPNGPAATASVHDLLVANGYAAVPVRRSMIPYRS